MFLDELCHPLVRGIAKVIGDVGLVVGNVQPALIRDLQQASDISGVPRHLGAQVRAAIKTVVPGLQFVKEEQVERSTRQFVDLCDVVRVDVWKLELDNVRREYVDLELLDPPVVVLPLEPQHSPRVPGVSCIDGVESIVCVAKGALDVLRILHSGGEANDVEILMGKVSE